MNLVFFIFCAFLIIAPNIINAKILKYDNHTCYGSCCRWANKPSNYSDILIEYSINFTVDEVIVTIWPENAGRYEPKLYSFTTNETGTSQSWEFSARDDFEYCFNAVKYGSENISSKTPFTFSFGYEYNAAKNQKILDEIVKLMEKEQKEIIEKAIREKEMEEEVERGINMEKQLLQKNETTSTDNSLRDENEKYQKNDTVIKIKQDSVEEVNKTQLINKQIQPENEQIKIQKNKTTSTANSWRGENELIINKEYQKNNTEIKINQDLVEEVNKTIINKQIQPENSQIEIQKSEIKNIKNELLNKNKTLIINDYETNKIDDTKKRREININFTQMTTEIPKQIMKIEQLSIDKENKTKNKLSIQNEIIKIEEQQKNKTTEYKEKQDEFNNYNITKNLTEIKYQTTIIKPEPLKTDQDVKHAKNYLNYFGMIWEKSWAARRT